MTSNLRHEPEPAGGQAFGTRPSPPLTVVEPDRPESVDAAARVLAERARALEQVLTPELSASQVLRVVTFTLANERYGIEADAVWEIARLRDFTPIPGAPPFLIGVINLRGKIVGIIDLRFLCEIPTAGLVDLSRVIILGRDAAEIGILAMEVQEVVTIRPDEILTAPEAITGIGKDLLTGVTRDATIILDGHMLLADSRLFINQSAEFGTRPERK